mmetsp:Transcript_9592/g.33704  ORF Transcript_9592/g.33704 Transcript_9592/m.33704 type:complete len:336 (-) Transcript_9592:74-1081(-)
MKLGAEIQSLWAGYGSIREATLDGRPVVCKDIDPPPGDGISHDRKVKSYEVESAFYRSQLPKRLRAAGAHVSTAVGPSPTPKRIVLEDLRRTHPLLGDDGRGAQSTARASLRWLAASHAETWRDATLVKDAGLWDSGTFWRLDTRPDEYDAIAETPLGRAARAIDLRLRGFRDWHARGNGPEGLESGFKHWALLHGDFKSANLFFTAGATESQAAACDWQYGGPGAVMKDVAYHLVGSVPASILANGGDEAFVHYYHDELVKRNTSVVADGFSREQAWAQYRLAVADYVRWMEGWGHWGAARYAGAVADDVLRELGAGEAQTEAEILQATWRLYP